jgi:hypothetical protein
VCVKARVRVMEERDVRVDAGGYDSVCAGVTSSERLTTHLIAADGAGGGWCGWGWSHLVIEALRWLRMSRWLGLQYSATW